MLRLSFLTFLRRQSLHFLQSAFISTVTTLSSAEGAFTQSLSLQSQHIARCISSSWRPTMKHYHRSQAPPLIDVDCNLVHPDLISVMNTSSHSNIESMDTLPDPFRILHHPSIRQSNIVAMISPSSTLDDSEELFKLLESSTPYQRNHISIKTTVGVHPYHTKETGMPSVDAIIRVRRLLDKSNAKQIISCIGEIGLDYSPGFPEKKHQLPWFRALLDLAFDYNLPVFLHERMAFEDTLRCIDDAAAKHQDEPFPKIIVHCFTGSFTECVEYVRRGYYISLSGYLIKEDENEVTRCLREGVIPLSKLMIETDAPYMGFPKNKDLFFDLEGEIFRNLNSKKTKRLLSTYPNVPTSLPLVLKHVCDEINFGQEMRGESTLSLEGLAAITTQNARTFFNLE